MENSNAKAWPPHHSEPKTDPAYFDKINAEMEVLNEKIPLVAAEPSNEEIWCEYGDLKYGHPVTPLILRFRALMWFSINPPDPRGEKMYSRPGPYTVFVRRADLVEILPFEKSTIDRMLAEVRREFEIKPYARITVKMFCYAHNMPEDEIQKKLDDLFKSRWNKHKRDDDD